MNPERDKAEAERDRLAELEDGYLADIATLNARIKRLAEALEWALGKSERGFYRLPEVMRGELRRLASMEGDKVKSGKHHAGRTWKPGEKCPICEKVPVPMEGDK